MGTARLVRSCPTTRTELVTEQCLFQYGLNSNSSTHVSRHGRTLTIWRMLAAQKCVQNCKCAPHDFDGLWSLNMSLKVPPLLACIML